MIIPMMFSGGRAVAWQAMYTYAGNYSFTVPEGCTSIAAVVIGSGGGGACGASGDTNASPAGGGGGLSYSNAIAVTPGETLTIVVPLGGIAGANMSSGNAAAAAGIHRGGTYLIRANGGSGGVWSSGVGGAGGAVVGAIGDVTYGGGKGQNAANFTYGGWSGRYNAAGVGGDSSQVDLSATLFGGDSGTSLGLGGAGGKSSANAGNVGGIRIMWGDARAFPGNAADIVRPGWWKFWRIYITAVGSGSVAGFAEMELRASPGGADMTNTGTRMAVSSGNLPGLIVNNDTSGDWTTFSQAAPWWVRADMGTYTAEQAVFASELAIWPNHTSTAAVSPKDFVVQGSLDGATWVDVKSFAGVTSWVAGTPKIFSLT